MKVNLYSMLFGMIGIMPIIDSISGAFHESYPVGQLYRIVFFVYVLFLMTKNARKDFLALAGAFFLFIGVQIVVSIPGGYIVKSIQDTIKLFTPIFMVALFQALLKKEKIKSSEVFSLLDRWSLLYPLLILIPSTLGLSGAAYGEGVGFKGFFYATNEISFIMSSLVIYRFYVFSQELSLKNLMLMALNTVCLLLMGTKTGYVSAAVGALLFGVTILKTKSSNKKLKAFGILMVVVIGMILMWNRIAAMTAGIFERWLYQRQLSYSTTDFLFSMRLRRLQDAFTTFFNGMYLPFGWGFGGELNGMENIEMDFIDLLLETGIVGFVYVLAFYGRKVKNILKSNLWSAVIVLWSFLLSFGAGHVLFYGQSGMMLALNIVYASLISKAKKRKSREENEIVRSQNHSVYRYV